MRGRGLALTPASPPPSRGRKQLAIAKNSPPLLGEGRGRGSKRVLPYLIFVLILLIPASCGRKGDPFLPQESMNARVVDLKGAWQQGYIELNGGIADPSNSESTITGARVHYAIYPVAEPPCDGCPIEFQGFHTYGTEVAREAWFFCKIPGVVRGNIYYFEVQLAGQKGVLGPRSNRVRVEVE